MEQATLFEHGGALTREQAEKNLSKLSIPELTKAWNETHSHDQKSERDIRALQNTYIMSMARTMSHEKYAKGGEVPTKENYKNLIKGLRTLLSLTKDKNKKKQLRNTIEGLKLLRESSSEIKTHGKYILGQTFSEDFDYDGMLKTGLSADISWGVANLRKLYDSFEDVNYHHANEPLWEAIKSIETNNMDEAKKHMDEFHKRVKDELKQ